MWQRRWVASGSRPQRSVGGAGAVGPPGPDARCSAAVVDAPAPFPALPDAPWREWPRFRLHGKTLGLAVSPHSPRAPPPLPEPHRPRRRGAGTFQGRRRGRLSGVRLRRAVPAPLLSEGAGLPRTPAPPGLALRPPAWLVRWPPPCPRPTGSPAGKLPGASDAGSLAARPQAEGMEVALRGLQGPRASSEPEAPASAVSSQGFPRGRAEPSVSRERSGRGAGEPAWSLATAPWGSGGVGEQRRPPAQRPPRERAKRGRWAAAGPGQTRGIPRGNGAGRVRPPGGRWTSGNLGGSDPIGAFPSNRPPAPLPPPRCFLRAPQPWSQEGALSGVRPGRVGVEAARPERARSAHAQKPRRRYRAAGKRVAGGGPIPAQAPRCPGPIPGSPAPSRAGRLRPTREGAAGPLGPGHPPPEPGAWSRSGRRPPSGSRACARKPNAGSAVPYLPHGLLPAVCPRGAGRSRCANVGVPSSAPQHLRVPGEPAAHLHNNGTGNTRRRGTHPLSGSWGC